MAVQKRYASVSGWEEFFGFKIVEFELLW